MELTALAAAIAVFAGAGNAIGEGLVVSRALDGIARNPDAFKQIRSTMILGVALVETTAIYALLIALLILFL